MSRSGRTIRLLAQEVLLFASAAVPQDVSDRLASMMLVLVGGRAMMVSISI